MTEGATELLPPHISADFYLWLWFRSEAGGKFPLDEEGATVEVHVDGFEGGSWRPLYRTRNSEWMSTQMDHARLRKLVGRFAREYRAGVFNELARFLANRAFADFSNVERVRVRLYRWESLPADRIRAGELPTGKYTQEREWRRENAP